MEGLYSQMGISSTVIFFFCLSSSAIRTGSVLVFNSIGIMSEYCTLYVFLKFHVSTLDCLIIDIISLQREAQSEANHVSHNPCISPIAS